LPIRAAVRGSECRLFTPGFVEENNVNDNFKFQFSGVRRQVRCAGGSFGDDADFRFYRIVFFAVAYGILSRMFPIKKEIEHDQNVALGIVIGSIMIGIALIIAAAIQG
jgi:hypothetical protein